MVGSITPDRLSPQLLQKAHDLHWIFSWSGNNWTLLDVHYSFGPQFDIEWQKICGTPCTSIEIQFSENRALKQFNAEEGYARMSEAYRAKLDADPGFLVRSGLHYREHANRDITALKRMYETIEPQSLSNDELADLFLEARSHFYYNAAMDRYDYRMELIFTPILEEYLRTRLTELGKGDMIAEYANTLITPRQKSVIFEERSALFEIVAWIRVHPEIEVKIKAGTSMADIFSDTPGLEALVRAHFERWVWMPVLVNNPPATLESVWREIGKFITTDAPLKVESSRLGDDYDPVVIERSEEFICELDPPERMIRIIEGLRMMAFLRTEDYVVMSESSYYVIPLYTEIAKRLGVSYYDLKLFRPEEIVDRLRRSAPIGQSEVERRVALSCFIAVDGEYHFFEEPEARQLWQAVTGERKDEHEDHPHLKGTIANKGKICGKARVALDIASVATIEPGDILILAWVGLPFIPYMRKAAGIVSEYGGLTSHPVIVARELNIPCIVGVKGATTILKTGDMVEVDAERGIITKL